MRASTKVYVSLALVAAVLAYVVVVLGAYVRLSDAGLGCPDWPGCYGRLLVPSESAAVQQANADYPQRPVEHRKAWKEMAHRYLAATLGVLIIALAFVGVRRRRQTEHGRVRLPILLVALVIFQGLLGMWTVTLLLKPLLVVLHLLGGMTVLVLLWWLALSMRGGRPLQDPSTAPVRLWAMAAVAVVYIQIALGGWTSSNYAALACTDFPLCHGSYWPRMDFSAAFTLWRGLGINYEFGVLDAPARTAIHYTHRAGALLTGLVTIVLAVQCWQSRAAVLRRAAIALAAAVALQIGLGIANVVYSLPLHLAVAHNAGAALVLLTVATVLYFAGRPSGVTAKIPNTRLA